MPIKSNNCGMYGSQLDVNQAVSAAKYYAEKSQESAIASDISAGQSRSDAARAYNFAELAEDFSNQAEVYSENATTKAQESEASAVRSEEAAIRSEAAMKDKIELNQMRTDSASQLGGVYKKDYETGDVIPVDAMKNKLMYWHNGQFYLVGTDTEFTSNDFDADLAAGRFFLSEDYSLERAIYNKSYPLDGYNVTDTDCMIINGQPYPLFLPVTGVVTDIQVATWPKSVKVDGVVKYLLDIKYYKRGELSIRSCGARGLFDDVAPFVAVAGEILKDLNQFEASYPLKWERGSYVWKSDEILYTVDHGSMRWYCDGNCTIDIQNTVGKNPFIVDFSTGGTANFLSFDMSGIHWSDISSGGKPARRGPRFKRMIGSKWDRVHMNNLLTSIWLEDDSNLNVFDSCQWRGNDRCFVGETGVSNNNLFINCQWRYNKNTILDCLGTSTYPTTFDEWRFLGGDIEPYNLGTPLMRLNNATMDGMRVERNTNVTPNFELIDFNQLRDVIIISDGGTQALGCAVKGKGNKIDIHTFSGYRAIEFESTANDNSYSVSGIHALAKSSAGMIVDRGDRNVAIVNGVAQTRYISAFDGVLPSLDKWVATGCSVEVDGEDLKITKTTPVSSTSYLEIHFTSGTGNYTGINVGLSAKPLTSNCQITVDISDTNVIGNLSWNNYTELNKWERGYFSSPKPIPSQPYFRVHIAGNNASALLRDFSASFNSELPSL